MGLARTVARGWTWTPSLCHLCSWALQDRLIQMGAVAAAAH